MNTNKLGQKENEELKKAGIIQEATNELQEENVTETENKED